MPAPAPKSRTSRKLPEKVGKYLIVKEVGKGSTGTVYLSHDPYYGRDVAIKVYNIDAGGDEDRARIARKMFLSEAHMVGMLQHPNILPIYDAGEYKDGDQWTVLRPGMTLTVEPGLYIRPAADIPLVLAGIGIRIEDDVRVTETGCDIFTTAPKTIAEIEEVMRHD